MRTDSFFVGSYGRDGNPSIYRYELQQDETSGSCCLKKIWEDASVEMPSYLCLNAQKKLLYAVEEENPQGRICAAELRPGGLERKNTLLTQGADPCHITWDQERNRLYVANYTGGSLSVFSLDGEGQIGHLIQNIQHEGSGPKKDRQEKAHVHFSAIHGDTLFVVDLGMDKIFRYHLGEKGELPLVLQDTLQLPGGTGPRHLVFHPEDPDLMYVLGELNGTVNVLRLREEGFTLLDTQSLLPEDFHAYNISAAIKFSEDGRYLLCSNRGHDSIALFRVAGDGSLVRLCITPTGGRGPRDFTQFGSLIVAANQLDNSLTVLRLAEDSLEPVKEIREEIFTPVFILREDA